ncbi:MAG TPA: hypothetical protein VJ302_04665 [Blastocatellia bacterium]|nr:hypothetical protein [Blastocatellia bacterium]
MDTFYNWRPYFGERLFEIAIGNSVVACSDQPAHSAGSDASIAEIERELLPCAEDWARWRFSPYVVISTTPADLNENGTWRVHYLPTGQFMNFAILQTYLGPTDKEGMEIDEADWRWGRIVCDPDGSCKVAEEGRTCDQVGW